MDETRDMPGFEAMMQAGSSEEFNVPGNATNTIVSAKSAVLGKTEKQVEPIAKKEIVPIHDAPISFNVSGDTLEIVNAVLNANKSIVKEISEAFEKKLEKLDEAIMELISSKVENERLKGKIDNLTRENYRLKKEVESFKPVVGGVFVKTKKQNNLF
jgi:mRNA-degrading endonuclease RelE of RelBE toxin-antitoxin system